MDEGYNMEEIFNYTKNKRNPNNTTFPLLD